MISFDDASLVLAKWRDEATPLTLFLADGRWLSVVGRCNVSGLDRFMLNVSAEPSVRISMGLANAKFNYEDRRATIRFINKDIDLRDAICALRIKFPVGPIALLIESHAQDITH